MKRLTAVFVILFVSQAAFACDNPLLGTWRSDGPRTLAFTRENARLSKRQDAFLAGLIGKMTITFDVREQVIRFPEIERRSTTGPKVLPAFETRSTYRVLFCDDRSAVIETRDETTGEVEASMFFFIGPDAMWVYGGTNKPNIPDLHYREYFSRVR